MNVAPIPPEAPAVGFGEALGVWARIGVLSFGGPTAQIALMHRVLVDERGWLSEQRFLTALSFCMLLPGPEAMQLATYAGWRLHGLRGGLAAGLLFVAPGALIVLALAAAYAAWGQVPLMEALFLGIKAAVLVIVMEALVRISRRALAGAGAYVLAGLAFVGIFFLDLPFPLIVLGAGVWGFLGHRRPAAGLLPVPAVPLRATARTVALGLAIWLLPLLAVGLLAPGGVLTGLAVFFSKLAVVTFGGAYAVLAYMAQDVVEGYGWLTAGEMLDGLGLAETTPGPLILVTEFVGYLAAHRHGLPGGWASGVAGAAVALWATFAPCFLWIFAGAPYVDRLSADPRLRGALAAITAAVVGVILNLTLWFALHVFFAEVAEVRAGPLRLWLPDLATLDLRVVALAGVSALLLLGRHWSIPAVLAVSGGLALGLWAAGL
ncbi:MAG TPA: chromate efflux transporter [Thermohalobaculum sp.]|nr:chromate efflux transporter [Thermohalobaculum sp.]